VNTSVPTRYIGIRHRRKKTKQGEARPTQLAVMDAYCAFTGFDLKTETDELDWLKGQFPISYRPAEPSDDLSTYRAHQIIWRNLDKKKNEQPGDFPPGLLRKDPEHPKTWQVAVEVPTAFDGLKPNDVVSMTLGSSGDRFAFALSRRGEQIGASVLRIPMYRLTDRRGEDAAKDEDPKVLAELAAFEPQLFYPCTAKDRAVIQIRQALNNRQAAQAARIAMGNRLGTQAVGHVFCNPDGFYPEGNIEAAFQEQVANDVAYQAVLAEEKKFEGELKRLVRAHPLWPIFDAIEGVGEVIAGRLIAAIGDAHRFTREPDKTKLDELRRQRDAILQEVGFEEFAKEFAHLLPRPDASKLSRIQLVRIFFRENEFDAEADRMEEAEALHRQVIRLYQHARRRGSQAVLKAYCGVHVMQGGKYGDRPRDKQFPRHLPGQRSNYSTEARQALYLVADQANRRPNSHWGKILRKYKVEFRKRHPEVIREPVLKPDGTPELTKAGKPKARVLYNDGHILNMARWRTASKFLEFLYLQWVRLDRDNGAGASKNAVTRAA
jgi:hypothetical protein